MTTAGALRREGEPALIEATVPHARDHTRGGAGDLRSLMQSGRAEDLIAAVTGQREDRGAGLNPTQKLQLEELGAFASWHASAILEHNARLRALPVEHRARRALLFEYLARRAMAVDLPEAAADALHHADALRGRCSQKVLDPLR